MTTPRSRDLAALPDDGLLHADDLRPGDFMDLGSVLVDRTELLEFAERYDPLPIHIDPEAATAAFGDLIAPLSLLIALYSSLGSRVYIPRLAIVAGKGIDRLRIVRPARADTTLHARVEVTDVVLRGGRGDVHTLATMLDDAGDVVLSFSAIQVVRRR